MIRIPRGYLLSNISEDFNFSENFASVLNGWPPTRYLSMTSF